MRVLCTRMNTRRMNPLRVLLQIVVTHLVSRKRQTLVAALGVTLGIGFYIAMVGFMTGADKMVNDLMLSATPHVRIYNDISVDSIQIAERAFSDSATLVSVLHPKPRDRARNIKDGVQMLAIMKRDPRVYGASPRVTSQVYYNYGTTEIPGTVYGVDLLEENKLYRLREKMTEGSLEKVLASENAVMMGGSLAEKLHAHVNDHVTVTLANGSKLVLSVAGIFRMGIALIDNSTCYATTKTVQKMLHRDELYLTDINIKMHNLEQAKEYAAELQQQFGYKADDWETANASILVSFTIRSVVTYTVSIAMLAVAGFGIYNIMTMMMYEKMKDIAILKAIGFDSGDIQRIFIGQALALGVIGAIAGMLFGFALSVLILSIPYHNDFLPGMDHMPMNIDWRHYLIGLVFALLSSGVAGFFPSRRASKVDPVVIIRG